jgi:hypothetical protein
MECELEEWDYDYLLELTKSGVGESDWYDFKSDFPLPDNVTAAVYSFANTRGGFYVLGVSDKKFQILGVDKDTELAHIFRQKIQADPYIHFIGPKLIPIPGSEKVVPVFYITLSDDRPHLPSNKHRRVFWKRINGGRESMTYLEILMAFQNYEERRGKIKLLYVELLANKIALQDILEATHAEDPSTYSPSTLEYTTLSTLLSDLYSIIGNNIKLIKDLLKIRLLCNAINNETSLFFGKMSVPIGDRAPLITDHNEYLRKQIDRLLPIIDRCLVILEKNYGVKNPLEDNSLT